MRNDNETKTVVYVSAPLMEDEKETAKKIVDLINEELERRLL